MNNLRKFATEADYSAATLNYPAVSWVVSGDTVHFDKTAPTPVVNDKVIMASYDGNGECRMTFFNCEASSSGDITSITLDNVAVNPIVCQDDYFTHDASQTYIMKYGLNSTTTGDWFTGDLGCGEASTPSSLDVLIPSQITNIGGYPSNIKKMVVEATTPPQVEGLSSVLPNAYFYVPDAVVNTYKYDGYWREVASNIYPISEYSGYLPV